MLNQIGKISKETFITIVNRTQKYFETISKIENAFGSIMLDCLSEYPCNILDVLERDMEIPFDDLVYDMIYNGKCINPDNGENCLSTGEHVWDYIEAKIQTAVVKDTFYER